MSENVFRASIILVALSFSVLFVILVIPALMADPDVVGAFAAGFVNPYSSGFASDTIACWVILALWVAYEMRTVPLKYGATCLALGLVPGVAVGFGAYLLLRRRWVEEA